MKRARATALVLVNWRGVFYERYLLDRHVTALEGTNGAGKTTVLIGAHVVLLPHMTRLRFTNVAEYGSTGGDRGIWGRLGETGRPSYSVLELRLPDGERLLAGVLLERRSEPTVELTPFVIAGLDDGIALQDVLLQREQVDAVPELPELRQQVARLGGRLQHYTTAKDYFSALFERDITPLRLATDEDRTKFSEMLRTSMTGGISRAITSGLRDFLLKEEPGLADTLKRMRANLAACRRTRLEVEESRRLEQEISGVYQAGHEMFAAAVHATRERAEELARKVEEAERRLGEAETLREQRASQLEEKQQQGERAQEQFEAAQQASRAAREHRDLLLRARVIQDRIEQREAAHDQATTEHEKAQRARDETAANRGAARDLRDETQADRDRAAQGLADLQRGVEELARRASEHRLVVEHLQEASRLLPDEQLSAEQVDGALRAAEARRRQLVDELVRIEQSLCSTEARRRDHAEVMEALGAIVS